MSSIDVVVPCYNYGRFLGECIQSVLDQRADVRVLIIDDASTDNTDAVARELHARDLRVTYIRHATNKGHIVTYNEGLLSWASGDYVLLLSADDLLTPGALDRAITFMDAHPSVGFIYGRAITTEMPDLKAVSIPQVIESHVLHGSDFLELACRQATNFVITPTAVVRTSLQQEVGGYRVDLPHTGDLEMWLRLAVHADVGVLNCDQAIYRIHGSNMHRKTYTGALTVIRQHEQAFSVLFNEFGDLIPDRERLERLSRRGVGLNAIGRAAKILEGGDSDTCSEIMKIGLEICPELCREPAWLRLRLKRLLGPRSVKFARTLLQGFRDAPILDRHPFGQSGVFPGI